MDNAHDTILASLGNYVAQMHASRCRMSAEPLDEREGLGRRPGRSGYA